MAVYLYESTAADFTANGLGAVLTQSGTVTEKAGGAYEVELICPVDEGQKWMRLQTGRILKAPVPERTTPALDIPCATAGGTQALCRASAAAEIRAAAAATAQVLERVAAGQDVVRIAESGDWAEVIGPKGTHGWCRKASLTYQGDMQTSGEMTAASEAFSLTSRKGSGGAWSEAKWSVALTLPSPIPAAATISGATLTVNVSASPMSGRTVYVNGVGVPTGRGAHDVSVTMQPGARKLDVALAFKGRGENTVSSMTLTLALRVTYALTQTWREAVPPRAVKEQLFRIYSVEQSEDGTQVRVRGKHISYDLLYNLVLNYATAQPTAAGTVFREILAHRQDKTLPFRMYSDVTETIPAADYGMKNPMAALLDEGTGAVRLARCMFLRDNFDLYAVKPVAADRGVTIRHGKNLTGAELSADDSQVYTHIVPVGEDKEGKPLLTEQVTFVSQHASYAYPRIKLLQVSGAKVGSKAADGSEMDEAAVRAKLAEAALAELAAGVDQPQVTLKVSFLDLGGTEEYAAYAGLQRVHLYDTVRVVHSPRNIDTRAMVVGYAWNLGTAMYDEIELGDPFSEQLETISGSQVSLGSITGNRLSVGCVGAGQMQDLAVTTAKIMNAAITAAKIGNAAITRAHIQDAAIGTAQIADASITNAKIGDAEIDVAKIKAFEAEVAKIASAEIGKADIDAAQIKDLSALVAKIVTANIGTMAVDWAKITKLTAAMAEIAQAEIENATIDAAQIGNLEAKVAEIAKAVLGDATIDAAQIEDLAAEVARIIVADIGSMEVDWAGITALTAATAEIVKAQIGTADIDWAHIKDLAAGTAIITKGEAGELYIARLAVTEANMVSLTLGELLLKGADGGFYAISVDENGEIVTTRKRVANDDVGDASINGGEKLIEGSVTAAVLNAQDIFADSAIIRELIAANLDVDTLFAREATITKLNAMDITGNEYLKALVEDGDRKNSGSLTVLADQLASQVKRVQEMQDALTGKADGAALTELATRITQTAEAIRAEVVRGDNLAAGLDEANKALASYKMSFQLDADGVTIAASNSKIDLHLANDRLDFRQNGQVVAYVSNERLYIGSAEVTDSLVVGRYEFKRMRDGSLGVLYRVPDESAPTDASAKLGEAKLGKLALGK